jgi:hypothetical protein
MLIGALLYAGPGSAIDDVDACRFYGVKAISADENVVHVVVPHDSRARSRGFVSIRRTKNPIETVTTERLRYVILGQALIAATRRLTNYRRILAVLSDGLERDLLSFDDLMTAHIQGPRRNALLGDDAMAQLTAGVRSAPEGGFRRWAEASVVLPPLLYNCVLELPGGKCISPDALAVDAGLVHETNGRKAHSRLDLFEDTMVRHTAMTAAGLIVVHNSPMRLERLGRQVLTEFERCYARYKGRGLPEGIRIVKLGPADRATPAALKELQRLGIAV